MTMPAGLLDQSAIAKLLASMTGGANLPGNTRPEPVNAGPAGLPQGGLLAPTPPFSPAQGPMNAPEAPNPGDSTHGHQGGFTGGVKHLLGVDRIQPEVAALLTPDQQKRATPGVANTLWNLVANQKGAGTIQKQRAAEMLNLTDLKKQRDQTAEHEKAWAQIQAAAGPISREPAKAQEQMEWMARSAAAAGIPQAEVTRLAAHQLAPQENRFAPDEPQIVRGIDKDGKPVIQGLDRTGKVVWEKPEAVDPAKQTARDDINFQRMANRAQPLATSFQRETERHQVVAEALTTLNGLRENALAGDGPAQHMLVFSLMKLADPGSAVRQDERADTKNAANVPERLRAEWNRLLGGGGAMSPATVRGFLATVDSAKASRIRDFDNLRKQFERRARILQVDPDLVVSDYFEALRGGDAPTAPRPTGKKAPPRPAGVSDAEWSAFLKDKGYTP